MKCNYFKFRIFEMHLSRFCNKLFNYHSFNHWSTSREFILLAMFRFIANKLRAPTDITLHFLNWIKHCHFRLLLLVVLRKLLPIIVIIVTFQYRDYYAIIIAIVNILTITIRILRIDIKSQQYTALCTEMLQRYIISCKNDFIHTRT